MSQLPFAPFVPAVNTQRLIWRGASGARYEFLLYPIGVHFFPNPGVYIFCKRAPNGDYDAVYIGEAESFEERLTHRLANHHQWPSICAARATHIAVLHVPGELALREAIETDLRRLIKTPCNRQ